MCLCGGHLFERRAVRRQADVPKPVALQSVSVEALLVGGCVRVEISQTFHNQEDSPVEAVYRFPLEKGNAVCALHADIDGHRVTGVCRRKEEALNEYDDAIASGHGAYTLSRGEGNDLELNLGNLPPNAVVVITIGYVTESKFFDGNMEWVLQSTAKNSEASYLANIVNKVPDFSLSARLDMPWGISSVSSPSHQVDFTPGTSPTEGRIKLSKQTILNTKEWCKKDFVLCVNFAKNDHVCPRPGFGQLEKSEDGSVCAMVTLNPALEWPENHKLSQEIIIVVDRSASMAGKRIAQMRDSLQLLLRSLIHGISFNIVGYGTTVDFLFKEGAVELSPQSFQKATKYVAEMRPNLGGTNVLKVLQKITKDPPKLGLARQILFITDGDVFNTADCIDLIRKEAAHTRVFTLGIGSDASVELVRGLSEAGGGKAEFVTTKDPRMEAKLMRHLTRMLRPVITELNVEWGASAAYAFPAQMRPLFVGDPMNLYALFDKLPAQADAEVRASGTFAGQSWETKIKLHHQPRERLVLTPFLVSRIIKELESSADPASHEEEIVRLSETYSLLSRYTSFVAVQERDEATLGTMKKVEVRGANELTQEDTAVFGDQKQRLFGHAYPGQPPLTPPAAPSAPASSSCHLQRPDKSRTREAMKAHEERVLAKKKNRSKNTKAAVAQPSPLSPPPLSGSSLAINYSQGARRDSMGEPKEKELADAYNQDPDKKDKLKEKMDDDRNKEERLEDSDGEEQSEDKAELEEENEANSSDSQSDLPGSPPDNLRALLLVQECDGWWSAEIVLPLLAHIGLSSKTFKEALSRVLPQHLAPSRTSKAKSPRKHQKQKCEEIKTSDLLATAIVLSCLRTVYASQQANWQLLAIKVGLLSAFFVSHSLDHARLVGEVASSPSP